MRSGETLKVGEPEPEAVDVMRLGGLFRADDGGNAIIAGLCEPMDEHAPARAVHDPVFADARAALDPRFETEIGRKRHVGNVDQERHLRPVQVLQRNGLGDDVEVRLGAFMGGRLSTLSTTMLNGELNRVS